LRSSFAAAKEFSNSVRRRLYGARKSKTIRKLGSPDDLTQNPQVRYEGKQVGSECRDTYEIRSQHVHAAVLLICADMSG
jgi:hypothetical protein